MNIDFFLKGNLSLEKCKDKPPGEWILTPAGMTCSGGRSAGESPTSSRTSRRQSGRSGTTSTRPSRPDAVGYDEKPGPLEHACCAASASTASARDPKFVAADGPEYTPPPVLDFKHFQGSTPIVPVIFVLSPGADPATISSSSPTSSAWGPVDGAGQQGPVAEHARAGAHGQGAQNATCCPLLKPLEKIPRARPRRLPAVVTTTGTHARPPTGRWYGPKRLKLGCSFSGSERSTVPASGLLGASSFALLHASSGAPQGDNHTPRLLHSHTHTTRTFKHTPAHPHSTSSLTAPTTQLDRTHVQRSPVLTPFHARQELRQYGKVGWNVKYDFNDSDFSVSSVCSTTTSRRRTQRRPAIPWDTFAISSARSCTAGASPTTRPSGRRDLHAGAPDFLFDTFQPFHFFANEAPSLGAPY